MAGLFLALAGVPLAFAPQLYDDFTLAKQVLLVVAASLVLAGWAAEGFRFYGGRSIQLALACLIVMLVVSESFAIDRRGSVLGVYQYRQGLLTQVSYVALFVGASRAGALGKGRLVAIFPVLGLAGVFAYTAVQAVGHDPIDWWIDTKDRAIGTIGNANELAAYAVVGLVAVAPVLVGRGRLRLVSAALVAAASTFIVFEAESRSGLVGLFAFAALLPVCWWLAKNPLRTLLRPGLAMAAGFFAGAILSSLAGGLEGSADRVQGGVSGEDPGGSTRFSLWRGAIEVIKAHPLVGTGPDGLFLSFPAERPADLGGAYDDYDLVAQSSHNYALDTAANYGLPGLLTLGALVAIAGTNSVLRTRKRNSIDGGVRAEPVIWAALAAYGALALLNPISLAAHTLFFVMLGLMAAAPRERQALPSLTRRAILAGSVLGPALAAASFVVIRLPLSDLEANRGWEDYDAQRFEEAARHYERAARLNPFERQYAQKVAETWLAASVNDLGNLAKAEDAYEDLDDNFGFVSGDALSAASAKIVAGDDPDGAKKLIERAIKLNPYGVAITQYTEIQRRAIVNGAILQYSQKHHWTYIDARPAP